MQNLLEQAKTIAEAIVEEATGIDLILVYGSLARGTVNTYSDIDILVISDKTLVSWAFVLDGRPVSVRSMTWDEAIGVAKGIHGTWSIGSSIFENHLVLWSKSKDVELQFLEASKYIPDGSQKILEKAVTNFTNLYGQLWRLQDAINHEDFLTPSFLIWNIAIHISDILAALNKKPMTHNWGKQLPEMSEFRIAPAEFASRYTQLVTSPPEVALPIATNLVLEMETLVREWFNDQKLSRTNSVDTVKDEWSGVADCLNKIRSAAEAQDLISIRYSAVEFAEFAIWLLRSIHGDQSNPKRFGKTLDELDGLPSGSQKSLETLLVSMNVDTIVEAGEQLAGFLESSIMNEGVKPAVAESVDEGKVFLRISTM
ncbi:MAG: nucleotidyltransferase domain-containing protein [Promethearchaeota archaeon]